MQRIEQLKLDGAWSFRQPKKQRGPVLPKTHWDYLMDEMVGLSPSLCHSPSASNYQLSRPRNGSKSTLEKNADGKPS
jgi:hypothetical protein